MNPVSMLTCPLCGHERDARGPGVASHRADRCWLSTWTDSSLNPAAGMREPARCRSGAYFRMLTARAITSAVVDSAIALCAAINNFAHRVSGIVSVGENAVALVKDT